MSAALHTLYIIGLGFALMLGLLGPKGVLRKLARMALLMLLFPFGVSLAFHVWRGLPPGAQGLLLVAGPPLVVLGLLASTRFGRGILEHFFGALLHTLVVGAFRVAGMVLLAPFRLLAGLVRALRR